MANFDQLKQSVAALIRTNGAEEITGQIMQDVLLTIINSISGGYMFGGVAQHNGNVGNPDYNVFYLAGSGAYTGYGGAITIEAGCYGVFRYNGTWTQEVVDIGVRLSGSIVAGETRGVTGDTINTALQTLFDNVMNILDSLTFTYNTPSAQQATKAMLDVIMTPTGGAPHVLTTLTLASATVAAAGLMSAEDKQKVDRMLTDFRSLSLTDTTAAADQATKIVQTLSATLGENPEAITTMTFLAATASKAGLMSAADKAVLDCLVAMLGYYECSTAAGTAAKTVAATGYSLTNGGCIRIKMTNANTAANVTLNINSTGAKALYYDGVQASSTNTWEAGEVLEVYYDGTQYQCASGGGGKFHSGQKVKDVNIFNNKDDIQQGYTNLPSSNILYGRTITLSSSDFEQGSLDPSTGGTVANNLRIRTSNYIEVFKGDDLRFVYNNQPYLIYYYNTQKTYLSSTDWISAGGDVQIASDGFVKILVRKSNNASITPSNLADVISIISKGMDERITENTDAINGLFGTSSDGDFEITDENNNVLSRFKNGHIRTKNFNSETDAPLTEDNASDGDLEISDDDDNILVRFKNGHIRTKNFDSSTIGNIEYYGTSFATQEQALYDKVRNDIDDKTVVLLLTTDAHITTEEQYTLKYAKAFRKMAENIGADAIVSLGDIINEKVGSGWDITANRDRIELYMKDTRNTYIPFLYALAHHEMYSSGYPTFLYGYPATKVLGKTDKYQRYMHPVFDTDNPANYYVDVKPQGLRMIFLDSTNVAGHPVGFTQATVNWLISVLGSTTGKIAIFSHVPSKNGYSYNPNNSISRVVNDDLVRTALNNYVQGGGDILGHYCGHAHCDNYGKESDMEYYIIQTACSVPRVDGGVPAAERPTLGTPIYYSDRDVGTLNEWCVDVACIHCDIDEVHMFRFGVGNDRVIQL